MIQISRIYQGKIIRAEFEDAELRQNAAGSPLDAILDTHCLFQDAVNYHIVALAGMCYGYQVPIASEFASRIKSIWTVKQKNAIHAETLQQSLARTLNLKNLSYEEAIEEIFCGIERRELLPYVLKYIMDSTLSGEGAIQKNGRELLPKLCNRNFGGNFEFSRKERRAKEGLQRLRSRLADANDDELKQIAMEMDLSWAGVKTQPNEYYSVEDSANEVKETVAAFIKLLESKQDAVLKKIQAGYTEDICVMVQEIVKSGSVVPMKPLAKNNKAVPILKQSAVLFMYYPCRFTADLLLPRLPKQKIEVNPADEWDIYTHLDDDPIILTRGKRGYVYKGFSALPCWETDANEMYEKEWDILAFKEALKVVHGFDLKQKERDKKRADILKNLTYMLKGEGNPVILNEDAEAALPVLYGDPRLSATEALIKELSKDEELCNAMQVEIEDTEYIDNKYYSAYTITSRALNAYEDVEKAWNESIKQGKDDTDSLQACVRKVQAASPRFGSQPLFDALCKPEYRCIWQTPIPVDKYMRSENILRDYGMIQSWKQELVHLSEPVRVTAAEPRFSPRPIMFSDLANLGANVKKGCVFVDHERGLLRIGVLVRNARGRWMGTAVRVQYSAPRFVRDQIGENSEYWPKKNTESGLEWIQPMIHALELPAESMPILEKTPAVGLAVSYDSETEKKAELYLNFPTRLNVEPLQQALGKNGRWAAQFSRGKDELLHLNWPYPDKKTENGWWDNAQVCQSGFSVLSVDLGVRYAAAYSLVRVAQRNGIKSLNNRDVVNRHIGHADKQDWYGAVVHQGLIKLNGEGRSTRIETKRKHTDVTPASSLSGKIHGVRMASEIEKDRLIRAFATVYLTPWFAEKTGEQISVLQMNKEAIRLFRRILSRNRYFASWVYKLTQSDKRSGILEEMKQYFNKVKEDILPEMREVLNKNDVAAAEKLLWKEATRIRLVLPSIAEVVTNSILPQQRYKWKWQPRSIEGYVGSGIMLREKEVKQSKVHRYFMGGLSVKRLSLLEELRHCLQSMNRQLFNQLGKEVKFGRETRNDSVMDPCPDILEKIDSIRAERVNQIAHNIVAQALGVRLMDKSGNTAMDEFGRDVYHGSYERIPGRIPVDFVVLENLKCYQTNIDKTSEENTTLMRWAHRQIVAKVKQLLTEVFGIPVLETHPAYTSKFDYSDSVPGFRAEQLTIPYCEKVKDMEVPIGKVYEGVLKQIQAENAADKLHLYRPQAGGEFFIAQHADGRVTVRNADMNASANIAWRALAAPDAFALLHRLRLTKTPKGELKLRFDSNREKAIKEMGVELEEPDALQVDKTGYVNAFYGRPPYGLPICFIKSGDEKIPFAYAKKVWGNLNKDRQWQICHRLNIRLLENAGYSANSLKQLMDKTDEQGDEIPM